MEFSYTALENVILKIKVFFFLKELLGFFTFILLSFIAHEHEASMNQLKEKKKGKHQCNHFNLLFPLVVVLMPFTHCAIIPWMSPQHNRK